MEFGRLVVGCCGVCCPVCLPLLYTSRACKIVFEQCRVQRAGVQEERLSRRLSGGRDAGEDADAVGRGSVRAAELLDKLGRPSDRALHRKRAGRCGVGRSADGQGLPERERVGSVLAAGRGLHQRRERGEGEACELPTRSACEDEHRRRTMEKATERAVNGVVGRGSA